MSQLNTPIGHDHTSSMAGANSFACPIDSTQDLPSGPCNFRDLSLGRHADTCGCRRFWRVEPDSTYQPDNRPVSAQALGSAWCFCGHHGCYHDLDASAKVSIDEEMQDSQQHNTRHARRRSEQHRLSASSARASIPSKRPSPYQSTVQQQTRGRRRSQREPDQSEDTIDKAVRSGLGLFLNQNADAQLPSTQHTSHLFSPDSPQQTNAQRATPISTFRDHVSQMRRLAPPLDIALAHVPVNVADVAHSATELATPSNAGTPAQKAGEARFTSPAKISPDPPNNQDINTKPFAPSEETENILFQLIKEVAELRQLFNSKPQHGISLQSLISRMDALENVSFSHESIEELNDKFDHFDGRLLDVENKVDDLEKFRTSFEHSDTGSFSTKSRPESKNQAALLEASYRLEDLEQRLDVLNAPSPAQPWEVEVVVLPWGRQLRGIWSENDEASAGSKVTTQDTNPQTKNQFTYPEEEWSQASLAPRACAATSGSGGRVYQRLKSRGFVRTISLTSKSARDVHAEICTQCHEVFNRIHSISQGSTSSASSKNESDLIRHSPAGLRSPFVPLRKVHKSSRLRFLSNSEVALPSLWNVEFLDSSVFMKAPAAGSRRLYVTTASAYTQSDSTNEWTWQRIRELPRVQKTAESKNLRRDILVGEADAMEPCWTWDCKLDPSLSVHSSFASGVSFEDQTFSPPQTQLNSPLGFGSDGEDESASLAKELESEHETNNMSRSSSQKNVVAPITPLSEFPASSRIVDYRRTVSLPLATSTVSNKSEAKPKPSSFEAGASGSSRFVQLTRHISPVVAAPKRRRMSPSGKGDGIWTLTPHRSHEIHTPPIVPASASGSSPSEYSNTALAAPNKRGPTPQAYATPYSNSTIFVRNAHKRKHTSKPGQNIDTDMSGSSGSSIGSSSAESEHAAMCDPEFALDGCGSADEEFDDAMTRDEESWAGVEDADVDVDADSDDDDVHDSDGVHEQQTRE